MPRIVTPQDPIIISEAQKTFDDVLMQNGGFIVIQNVQTTLTFTRLKKQ